MKIAIVGFDLDGRSTYDYFAGQDGHALTILDQDTDKVIPAGADAILGADYLDSLDRFDLIVRTSGMHPQKILNKNPGVAVKITTQINEFIKRSPTRNIIGVTGTKGKGTTSTLITNMLEVSGKTVRLGGNIGIPPLGFIDELDADSWAVLEMSSFQLMDLQHSPSIAVCLMVVPEHQDWHADPEDYYIAKQRLFANQKTGDVAIYYFENPISRRIAAAGQGKKVPFCHAPGAEVVGDAIAIDGVEICKTNKLKLLGRHNWQNVCAAVTALWHANAKAEQQPNVAAMRQVLTNFSGLPFRLEFVRELHGVKFYNDSFGTTPETASVALQAFSEPKVVILGGSDKGADYAELARVVLDNNVRRVLLIGSQAQRLQTALQAAGFHDFTAGGTNMAAIVKNAAEAAQSGDVVLLSTGCASFDMFKNYKDRGSQFTGAVQALTE